MKKATIIWLLIVTTVVVLFINAFHTEGEAGYEVTVKLPLKEATYTWSYEIDDPEKILVSEKVNEGFLGIGASQEYTISTNTTDVFATEIHFHNTNSEPKTYVLECADRVVHLFEQKE